MHLKLATNVSELAVGGSLSLPKVLNAKAGYF